MINRELKTISGHRLKLPPHEKSCDLGNLNQVVDRAQRPLAVDLFCGAGGLSLGLEMAGFDVILGVDRYEEAVETHRAYFPGASVLGDLVEVGNNGMLDAITSAFTGRQVALVAGGPPCQPFSRAGSGKLRSLIEKGLRPEEDYRQHLWQPLVQVVERLKPRAVLIENVPDLGSQKYEDIFRALIAGLEELGYRIYCRILSALAYGVPQSRQRLFLVAVQPDSPFSWPLPVTGSSLVLRDAISDLPLIQAGEGQEEMTHGGALTDYQDWCRRGMKDSNGKLVFDHVARRIRSDDLEAFRLMDADTRYPDLPDNLRRYREDTFDDKYKRLPWDQPCRAITAHLARDGYWYIHPEQHRSLTVREAARVQGFPDWYRFAGTPTHAFRQIGEAVPPLMAQALGRSLLEVIGSSPGKPEVTLKFPPRARDIEERLVGWLKQRQEKDLHAPWRVSGTLWLALLGMEVFQRVSEKTVTDFWPTIKNRWSTPEAFLQDDMRHTVLKALKRHRSLETLESMACALDDDTAWKDSELPRIKGVASSRVRMALSLCGETTSYPPGTGITRVLERLYGQSAERSQVNAQIMLSRALSNSSPRDCYVALWEIADSHCLPDRPSCADCPLDGMCYVELD